MFPIIFISMYYHHYAMTMVLLYLLYTNNKHFGFAIGLLYIFRNCKFLSNRKLLQSIGIICFASLCWLLDQTKPCKQITQPS